MKAQYLIRAAGMAALMLACVGVSKANAAGLAAGEYSCVGVGGQILIGLGFRLDASGRYVSLDNTHPGQVAYDAGGATVTFKGGTLDGYVGTNVANNRFNIHTISCQRIH
ncbi:MAG TPA: hypothetical protein VLX09_22990 [Stellaceae bacterium]|nr:hypothetical protein [Stellaceae bacterium]